MDSLHNKIKGLVFAELLSGEIETKEMEVLQTLLNSSTADMDLELGEKEDRKSDVHFEKVKRIMNFDDFQKHFGLERLSFENLFQKISAALRNETHIVPLEKKVLITLWVLATPESFQAVGKRFGVSPSTAHLVFKQIIDCLNSLLKEYIKIPTEDELCTISENFKRKSMGIPGICGVIDCCHIPIKQPVRNEHEYYNKEMFHSVILQAICDDKGLFTNIFVGMPGRMNDSDVYSQSGICKKICNGDRLWPSKYHLVGDCTYYYSQDFITPFKDNGHLSVSQIHFNEKLSSIRSTIERAFALLKGQWKRLNYLDFSDHAFICKIISSSCVLHNYILKQNSDCIFEPEIIISEPLTCIKPEPLDNVSDLEGFGMDKSMYTYSFID